jgi:hypothetical protein
MISANPGVNFFIYYHRRTWIKFRSNQQQPIQQAAVDEVLN